MKIPHPNGRGSGSRGLAELTSFGSNPGNLKAWLHLPDGLESRSPLVVVLHGCTQTASAYDQGSGWSTLADRNGFALLYPEQQRGNNPNLCFNWFQSGDIRRGAGEAASIRAMIDHLVEAHDIDPQRIFVTGLSAGGAMANVMLAAYPEVFSAGAIIAGLPYGTADSVSEAFDAMRARNAPDTATLQVTLSSASSNRKNWPRISVWQGMQDHTVKAENAGLVVSQWQAVHGARDSLETTLDDGHVHSVWRNAADQDVIELYQVRGMGHGVPLAGSAGAPLGETGPFMLETGLSSTARIAAFFGIADEKDVARAEAPAASASRPKGGARAGSPAPSSTAKTAEKPKARVAARSRAAAPDPAAETGITKVLHDAFRAAGLMR